MTCTTAQPTPLMTYGSTPANQNTGMVTHNTSMSESSTSSRTTMPARTTPSTRQPTAVIPLKIHYVTDFHNVVCMYTNPQVRFVSRENR